MRYNKWTGKSTYNEYYICSAASAKKCDGVGAVHKDKIESIVLSAMKEKIKSLRIEQHQDNPNQAEINKLKAEIAEKNKQIDSILKNFAFASQTVIKRMNFEVDFI